MVAVSRAQEIAALLEPAISQLLGFIASADDELQDHINRISSVNKTSLIDLIAITSDSLRTQVDPSLKIKEQGQGLDGFLGTLKDVLSYSVNTTAPGFLDKLYASPLPPGIVAELILAILNTNVHVYQVSPFLTLVEKETTKALTALFGLNGPRAGGINVQGGSSSNLTSIVVARNHLFPETKKYGNNAGHTGRLLLFTSSHGHYSIEKAAQALGFGSQSVVTVPVDDIGRMVPVELDRLIRVAKQAGDTPFYINATAGTTVLGSFDKFQEIAIIAKRHRCWFHVDGAWGGSYIFAGKTEIKDLFKGVDEADSIAINPHKMLGVPLTCSFLLARDLKLFEEAMTLRAGYLFHDADVEQNDGNNGYGSGTSDENPSTTYETHGVSGESSCWSEPDDLADLTLQCGRKGDALKFFLSWQYYGNSGYRDMVEKASELALKFSRLVDDHKDMQLVLGKGIPPQCLQVCFYYTPNGSFVFGTQSSPGILEIPGRSSLSTNDLAGSRGRYNTMITSRIVKALLKRGFMVDYAPALDKQEDKGAFFRVVINISTVYATVERLVNDISDIGWAIVLDLEKSYEGQQQPRE